jgi:superfamily II DNA helicase RecQ
MLIKDRLFLSYLAFLNIDEARLLDSWGSTFRSKAYTAVSNLRHRLPPSVVWIGLTATLVPGPSEKRILESLGFTYANQNPNDFTLFRLPIDRPNIVYRRHFL